MPEISGRLITYCTNIHPGNSWKETFAALDEHIPQVKRALAPAISFPIGLRLSHRAAQELNAEENRKFVDWLQANNCHVPTLNGFPYGDFHGETVKAAVYLPDWRSPERTAYTLRLADLLAGWLGEGVAGSISTVPIGFKGVVERSDLPAVKRQLSIVLTHLARLQQELGKEIILALEPEPGCLLETTEEVCRFFDDIALAPDLRPLLGICYDCCHQAVEFEDPAESIKQLTDAGIRIAKVQISSALSVRAPDVDVLNWFNESRYLHQVVVKDGSGGIHRYSDLPEACAGRVAESGDEWRCHFHVPIFFANADNCGTTRPFLEAMLPLLPADILMEVETYTWDVLPAELRLPSVTESIIRELDWLTEQLHAPNGSS